VRFTSVGDEFSQTLFFTSQSLHPRVVFLIFSVCVGYLPYKFRLRMETRKFHSIVITTLSVAKGNGQLASKKKFSFFGLILFVSEKETTL
jgi:hypothetical protein